MEKKTVSAVTLTLLLIGILTLAFNIQPVRASGTIYIRADGSVDPPTAPISTFDNVTYTFIGNISDSIVVERDNIVVDGAGYIVQGTGSGKGMDLSWGRNVTIKNMEIKAFEYGIYSTAGLNNISGNNITNNSNGVLFYCSSKDNICGNNITNNKYIGILLVWSSKINVSDNNVANNRYGIALTGCRDNTLRNNNATNNEYNFAVYGQSLSQYIHDIDASNTVDGKPVRYLINKQDMTFPLDAGYIALVNCTRITVKNLNPTNNMQGILLAYTTDSTITKNNITDNDKGIYLYDASNNSIRGNNLASNENGVDLDHSSNNSISGNNITANNFKGIALVYSSKNNVSGNNITANNSYGIELSWSSNNSVSGNNITAHSYYGIMLEFSSNYNSISGNNIANNDYGAYLYGSSKNNIISHNNFINNTNQAYTDGSTNVWDDGYPSGGNYWSDYAGVDANGDGIGDVPYVIDADNRDRYPLMYMWSPLPAHNINTGLGYATIQEAINANETQDGHTIYVEAGTYYEHVTINKSIALIGEDRSTTAIDGGRNGTVVLVIANNTMISEFTIRESGEKFVYGEPALWCGIMVGGYETFFENVTIMNNHIRNNYIGVLLWSSINSKIIDNNIENNTYGIIPFVVFRSDISHNNLSNSFIGISAQYVLQSNISSNTITSNEIAGLRMQDSSFNIIDGNYIENNWYGIDLSESDNNNITRNTLTSNEYGISLGRSGSNLIYHNNFIWNSIQVYNSLSNNTWNDLYPSGGNYWSDYTGVDVKNGPSQNLPGSDGIGDTPYIIDANNTDHYPLMNPYGAPPPPAYSLTITATVGGTTDPAAGTYGYTANSTVQVTALPNTNYLFDYWELDSVNVGSANPYSVYMDKDHTLKAVFSPIPPPLSVSITPLSASMLAGQSVTFTSTVSGGYTPYSYQWYLNGAPVSGATSSTWTFTPTTSGIYYVYLKVTDAKGNITQSQTARITAATVPVGGYSFPIQVQTKAEPIIPYIALMATLTAIFIKLKPKTKRKHRQ